IVPMLKPRICELDVKNLKKFKIFALDVPNFLYSKFNIIFEKCYITKDIMHFRTSFKNCTDRCDGIQVQTIKDGKFLSEYEKLTIYKYIKNIESNMKIRLKYLIINKDKLIVFDDEAGCCLFCNIRDKKTFKKNSKIYNYIKDTESSDIHKIRMFLIFEEKTEK
ncbi:hypothetical protein COBT_003380, partial [Conglomerata obtusa]